MSGFCCGPNGREREPRSLQRGKDGKSAYDIWLCEGNTGSVEDFLESLKGDPGETPDVSGLVSQEQSIGDVTDITDLPTGFYQLDQEAASQLTNAPETSDDHSSYHASLTVNRGTHDGSLQWCSHAGRWYFAHISSNTLRQWRKVLFEDGEDNGMPDEDSAEADSVDDRSLS